MRNALRVSLFPMRFGVPRARLGLFFFFHIHQAESPVLPFVSGCDPWQEAWRQKPETGRVQYPLVVYKGSVHIEASREDEGDKVEDFTG